QLPQVRNLGELSSFALLFFVFLLDGIRHGIRGYSRLLGINLPEWRMAFYPFVEARLGGGGVVHFAVGVAAVADEVTDHVGIEFRAVFRGQATDADHGVGIFRVDVKDRHTLAARDAGGVTRRMLLRGARGKANKVVNDDVDGAADTVGGKIGEIQ